MLCTTYQVCVSSLFLAELALAIGLLRYSLQQQRLQAPTRVHVEAVAVFA